MSHLDRNYHIICNIDDEYCINDSLDKWTTPCSKCYKTKKGPKEEASLTNEDSELVKTWLSNNWRLRDDVVKWFVKYYRKEIDGAIEGASE